MEISIKENLRSNVKIFEMLNMNFSTLNIQTTNTRTKLMNIAFKCSF